VLFGEVGGKGVAGALVAALIALACAFAMPAVAAAEEFTVNSTADGEDAAPGDEFCKTAAAECTLRAAIEESNTLGGEDTIRFDKALFDGGPGGTIALGSTLPTIEGIVSIVGECVLAGDFVRPCVGVDGPDTSEPALIVKNTEFVKVVGLAITGAETGIEVIGTRKFQALSDWLGVKLDGSAGGNGTGILLLGPGSKESQIGNEGETNVFGNNTADGLDIHGVSGVRVMGGYFGVGPDGATPAPNGGKGIEIAAFGGAEAIGNRIGTQVEAQEAATPECDGGCNVIAASGSSGIDLEGDSSDGESAAADTTIVGNYIGLDASGSLAIPNAADGVRVGGAARIVIGGPRVSEANRFAGGNSAVSAGPAAANLVVRGNSIGVGAGGGSLEPPDTGIVVNSQGLPGPAAEAVIGGNELRMQGGVAVDLEGFGGWIVGNEISGAAIGISTLDPTEGHGNLIEGNLIEDSALNGIFIESSFNEIVGNEVVGSGGAGIRLEGAHSLLGFGVNSNLVGGSTEADENLIAGSGGDAIEILNLEKTNNEVARNWGFANGGLFIDLVSAVPATEKKGPNKGIKPPIFTVATQSKAAGFGAEPEAKIRVFRKASAEAGEIESFLGEAIADKEGVWDVVYDAPISPGTIVAATQTGPGAGTSELAVVTTPAGPRADSPARPCALIGGCGGVAPAIPQTKIFKGQKRKRLTTTTAVFRFESNLAGSSFQCKLDGGPFRNCHSPKVYTGLKPGKHRFEVRAANSAGQVDASPAKLKFTVLG
jgi:CSLREA domain-containing protein